jgi:hypothetical protein
MTITPEQILESLPGHIIPARAKDIQLTCQFDLIGENGGQWYVTIRDGTATVQRGVAPMANVTVQMADWYFVGTALGTPNLPLAFHPMTKVKITAEMALFMKFQTLFTPFLKGGA